MNLTPAPTQQGMTSEYGFLSPTWAAWFRNVWRLLAFPMAAYASFAPAFTGLAVVGTVAVSGTWTRARNIVHFSVTLTPSGGGTSAATLGVTSLELPAIDGNGDVVPASENGYAQIIDRSTGSAVGIGIIPVNGTGIYLPTWAATSDEITIIGSYLVDDT